MSSSLSQSSLPVFKTGLAALSAILDKAAAHAAAKKIEPGILVGWRLAPDMFPLSRQIQIATDGAKNGSARLAGIEAPRFEDDETTLEALRARIDRTVAFLGKIDPSEIDAAWDRDITFPLGPQKGVMKGGDYLHHFVLPNFYFHLTTAYAILRQCGVEIGKLDYLGTIPLTRT